MPHLIHAVTVHTRAELALVLLVAQLHLPLFPHVIRHLVPVSIYQIRLSLQEVRRRHPRASCCPKICNADGGGGEGP